MSQSVVFERIQHAAHYGNGGHDLDTWTYAQPERLPCPASVPRDAQYRSGFLRNGVQHWIYVRIAPLSDGTCVRCNVDGGIVTMSQSDPFRGVRLFDEIAAIMNERYGHKMRRIKGGKFTVSFYDRKRWHWVDEYWDDQDAADCAEHILLQGYRVRVNWETDEREEWLTFEPYDVDTLRAELRGPL